jgi:hypothetical protein
MDCSSVQGVGPGMSQAVVGRHRDACVLFSAGEWGAQLKLAGGQVGTHRALLDARLLPPRRIDSAMSAGVDLTK